MVAVSTYQVAQDTFESLALLRRMNGVWWRRFFTHQQTHLVGKIKDLR